MLQCPSASGSISRRVGGGDIGAIYQVRSRGFAVAHFEVDFNFIWEINGNERRRGGGGTAAR